MPDPIQAVRSRTMSAIRSKNTKPEKWVRSALHGKGFRFRLHNKQLPGSPDLVLPKYHAVIFVNGCFWHQHHGCKVAHIPKAKHEFWQKKFERNMARDQKVLYGLKLAGWRVAIIWECGLAKATKDYTLQHLAIWLHSPAEYFETPIYEDVGF
jgi:DNA mismatch endonuclease, patch repair protein